ncbi:MAG: hypothetical protein IPK80_19445 [Nannocystis sp.]|nr:hypothetical protein [Nannocystis sp.]
MAPELFLHAPADARSDLFALCVTLHEALYGQRPFRGKSYDDLKRAILAAEISPPPTNSPVPAHVRRAVLRGLAQDPAERWSSVKDLLDELDRDPERTRRRGAVATALTAALGLTALAAWQWRDARVAADLAACRAPEAEVAALYSPERRAAARTAILATALPYAARSTDVVDALDGFIRAWTDEHAATCRAAVVDRALAPDLRDLRERCGERQRAEVAATLDVILAADTAVVEHLDQIVAHIQYGVWRTSTRGGDLHRAGAA